MREDWKKRKKKSLSVTRSKTIYFKVEKRESVQEILKMGEKEAWTFVVVLEDVGKLYCTEKMEMRLLRGAKGSTYDEKTLKE